MRPLTALLILAACQCLHAHQHPRTPRLLFKETLHALLGKQSKPVHRIVSCTKNLGLSKCISALGVWRAERAIDAFAIDPMARFDLSEDVETFPWKKYSNVTDEQLYSQLYDGTQKLLRYRHLTFDMISGYTADLKSKSNGSFSVDIHRTDDVEGRSSMKKIQKEFYNLAPIFLAPGLFISAMVPFIIPTLKMMILMVGMMNNMALVGAVFTILRNNAFNDNNNANKVIYVNNGYENEKLKFSASNNEEHFHTNHLGILYEDPKSNLPLGPLDGHFDDNFGNIEEIPPLSVDTQWIKEYTDGKMMQMFKKHPNDDIYFNGRIPIRRSKPDTQS